MLLVVKNRPGELARQELRQAWKRTARQNLSTLLVAGGVSIAVRGVPLPHAYAPLDADLHAGGIFVTAMSCALAWCSPPLDGRPQSLPRQDLGEEMTAEAVRNRRRRWNGWRLVNGIYFRGHGDVDHVLVGPGGIFALESKWTSIPWQRSAQGGIIGPEERDPLLQACDGAHKIEGLLSLWPQRFHLAVDPVVVLWGPGAPSLTEGWVEVDGVLVARAVARGSGSVNPTARESSQPLVESVTRTLEAQLVRQVDRPRVTANTAGSAGTILRSSRALTH